MGSKISVLIQYLIPQHTLTKLLGWAANIRSPRIKNWMIRRFIKKYQVDMSLAQLEKPEDFPTFNSFFIRQLKPALRPIAQGSDVIISPVDGKVAQIGSISKNLLLQAKGHYFDLTTLLGGDEGLAQTFHDGSFATLYLAPSDYHRIHMPCAGTLTKSIFIPGRLFSVNRLTSELIPNLYSRNERLVTLFNTDVGQMAVILVGAMIVGSMQTVWMQSPIKSKQLQSQDHEKQFHLSTGAELGHFQLGSTVIVLFEKNKVLWDETIMPGNAIQFGQKIGNSEISR